MGVVVVKEVRGRKGRSVWLFYVKSHVQNRTVSIIRPVAQLRGRIPPNFLDSSPAALVVFLVLLMFKFERQRHTVHAYLSRHADIRFLIFPHVLRIFTDPIPPSVLNPFIDIGPLFPHCLFFVHRGQYPFAIPTLGFPT
jgi:hypothetical protein